MAVINLQSAINLSKLLSGREACEAQLVARLTGRPATCSMQLYGYYLAQR